MSVTPVRGLQVTTGVTAWCRRRGNVATMNDRAPAPGGLALVEALVNTLLDIRTGEDALDRPEVRARFGIPPGELDAARALRESLRAACLAHAGHPPHREVTPLTDLLATAPLHVRVDPADGAATLAPPDDASLTSRVAAAIAEATTTGTWPRLKACEASDCHWAYYDRSPAARSRWCDMRVCGARAKMRRYRAK
ncbi:CGNR zinc finger domain-containing protein [Streptomyces sp. NPDC059524]|uniref:CGNR zinc finger domain-containing protein n=1 Tax=Streptomyces sp. NPDC059524 TaxID=3346856 RepID=UPI0036AD8A46